MPAVGSDKRCPYEKLPDLINGVCFSLTALLRVDNTVRVIENWVKSSAACISTTGGNGHGGIDLGGSSGENRS